MSERCRVCGAADWIDLSGEIARLLGVIKEVEFCLTVAVIPDGHKRCEMALDKLRVAITAGERTGG